MQSLLSSEYFYLFAALGAMIYAACVFIKKHLIPKLDTRITTIEKEVLHAIDLYNSASSAAQSAKGRYDEAIANSRTLIMHTDAEIERMRATLKARIAEIDASTEKSLQQQEVFYKENLLATLREEMIVILMDSLRVKFKSTVDTYDSHDYELSMTAEQAERIARILH